MEKFEVGEYIKTPYGKIEKIEKIELLDNRNIVTTNVNVYSYTWLLSHGINHSKNIIDLIELKDIVEIQNTGDKVKFTVEIFDEKTMMDFKLALEDKDIILLSVLPREIFEKNSCKV